ncbi:MAG: 2Fe-2S iron-sulfur cluster binding domain-containing protein [Phycisphaerae bacterium]|nr:2Fe-2S iron-sulfur cluster binding domain-containing protein [Phycisphaerae bacterium]
MDGASQPPPPKTCAIDVNDGAKTLHVPPGKTLFEVLNDADIHLPTICGGRGKCGRCRLTVLSGADEPTDAEKKHLSADQLKAGLRLGCQVKVNRDLAIRVPEEVLQARPFRAKLESVRDLTHDIKRFRFELTEPQRIEFIPGRYIKLHLPKAVDPSGASRAFSIASPPSEARRVELIVRLHPDGTCTNWMFNDLQAGQEVRFDGPYGQFGLTDGDAEMIWIAGGSGMSAFWSILRHLAEMKNFSRPTTLYFGAVARRDLYLQEELRGYEKQLNWFTYVPALSQPAEGDAWEGQLGLVTDVAARRLENVANVEAYLCGPPGMIDAGLAMLHAKGLGQERIFFDKFEHR